MELHSETFNPADFAARINAHACGGGAYPRAGGKNPDILGVRLGVKQTGCAGFGYVLDTVTAPEKMTGV